MASKTGDDKKSHAAVGEHLAGLSFSGSWGFSGNVEMFLRRMSRSRGLSARNRLCRDLGKLITSDDEVRTRLVRPQDVKFKLSVKEYGETGNNFHAQPPIIVPLRQLVLSALADAPSGSATGALVANPERFGGQLIVTVVFEWGTREQQQVGEVSGSIVEAFREGVASKLGDLPEDYPARRQVLAALHDVTRSTIAKALESVLNDHAAEMPHATYEEKKELAKWVNAELRRFGLAIKCPKTGRPAILIGHATGVPGVGRFHIEVLGEEGVAKRTFTGVQLPKLELTLADLTWAKGSAARGRD